LNCLGLQIFQKNFQDYFYGSDEKTNYCEKTYYIVLVFHESMWIHIREIKKKLLDETDSTKIYQLFAITSDKLMNITVENFWFEQNQSGIFENKTSIYKEKTDLVDQYYKDFCKNAYLQLGKYFEVQSSLPNYEKAYKNYEKATHQGNAEALYRLGYLHEAGLGVDQNIEKAADYYLKSADLGHDKAAYHVGMWFKLGKIGNAKDYIKALQMFTKATNLGNIDAANSLAVLLQQGGSGVDKDYDSASQWFIYAANKGNTEAMFNLGLMYECGTGVPISYEKAFEWYEKAAKAGDSDAKNKLGMFYEQGLGINADVKMAYKWYFQAAKSGHVQGQNNLGRLKGLEALDEMEVREDKKSCSSQRLILNSWEWSG